LTISKVINQNIIGIDGISVMYDTNNFFEIKKKNDKVVVRAKLPTESEATEQGQLYRDSSGYLKIK